METPLAISTVVSRSRKPPHSEQCLKSRGVFSFIHRPYTHRPGNRPPVRSRAGKLQRGKTPGWGWTSLVSPCARDRRTRDQSYFYIGGAPSRAHVWTDPGCSLWEGTSELGRSGAGPVLDDRSSSHPAHFKAVSRGRGWVAPTLVGYTNTSAGLTVGFQEGAAMNFAFSVIERFVTSSC